MGYSSEGLRVVAKGKTVIKVSLRQQCGFLPKPDFKEWSPGLFSSYYG